MYLYFFERILRASSGDDDFALPYWNYSVPAQKNSAVFRTPADSSNTLFVMERRNSINNGQPVPDSATTTDEALGRVNFASPAGSGLSFGGQIVGNLHTLRDHGRLESQPHDVIHVIVGGAGWMSDPNLAARDQSFGFIIAISIVSGIARLALGGGRINR
jgi:tyrosinase